MSMKYVSLWMVLLAALLALSVACSQGPEEAATSVGDAERGMKVFQQCAACHAADSDEALFGPGFKGFFAKDKLMSGEALTEASVREAIDAGRGQMPAYADMLTSQEKDDLITYLKTL